MGCFEAIEKSHGDWSPWPLLLIIGLECLYLLHIHDRLKIIVSIMSERDPVVRMHLENEVG